ncbi:MAG: amidase [Actinomycetota bacterium]|nr:amidase [Actinomycetota bacterium]
MQGIWITELGPGPAGLRLAVKDLFDTAGIRTTYGSAVFADNVPTDSAGSVRRLEAAGWVNVGKANLHEFAYGVTSQNLHYGIVPNPAFAGHTAGGSSGGSAAALAAGLADGALGSDTGGSIRIPAACCGVVGLKPGFDVVPIDGVFPLAPSFDHAGPMASDVAGCVTLMGALVPGFAVASLESLEAVSVGVAWADRCAPLVRERVLEAAALFPRRAIIDFPTAEAVHPVFQREVGDVHRDLYPEHAELYGDNIRGKIERCIAVDDPAVEVACAARAEHAERAAVALEGHDLLLAPTLPFVAPPADVNEIEIRGEMTLFTFPFNALGWPALALPCGVAEDGIQASLQVIGRPGADSAVLAAGLALEAALEELFAA